LIFSFKNNINNLKRALLITLDTEMKFRSDELMVEAIPYWRYWSIRISEAAAS
jgi:hypothetical protein